MEASEEQILQGFDQAYWVQAWTAHVRGFSSLLGFLAILTNCSSLYNNVLQAAMKVLACTPNPGAKIVFVGSTLSLLSFVGFATYSPGKFALRGLAETLRSEGILYGIDVQIFFAPTMRSPGLENENRIKPAICAKFEEGDEVLECDQAAKKMLNGKLTLSFERITPLSSTQVLRATNFNSAQLFSGRCLSTRRVVRRLPRIPFLALCMIASHG